MRIKLQRSQLEGIELLLGVLITDNPPTNVAERLVFDHVFALYGKIRAKVESLMPPRSGWSLSLTDFEAMAFYVFYQNVYVPTESYRYEALQLQKIFNEIDLQNYGRPAKTNLGNRGLATGTPGRLLGSSTR